VGDSTVRLPGPRTSYNCSTKDQRPDDGRVRFDEGAYKRRAVVEQCVGWLKECRAVATRFDKLAVNYLATVKLAMIQRYLRLLAP
jgi:transposase